MELDHDLSRRQAVNRKHRENAPARVMPVLTPEEKLASKAREEAKTKEQYAIHCAKVASKALTKSSKTAAKKEAAYRRKVAKAARWAVARVQLPGAPVVDPEAPVVVPEAPPEAPVVVPEAPVLVHVEYIGDVGEILEVPEEDADDAK